MQQRMCPPRQYWIKPKYVRFCYVTEHYSMISFKNIQNWQVKVQGSWTYSRYAVTFASAGHRLPVLGSN
jgi:hypothetical protein